MNKLKVRDIYYTVAHRTKEHIASFSTRYDDFDTSVIPKIFEKELNAKVLSFEKSKSWGTAHVIYYVKTDKFLDPLVFRANTGFTDEPEYEMVIEKLITDDMESLGLPANKILIVDVSRNTYNFDYQIEEMLEGGEIEIQWDYYKNNKEEYNDLYFQIGQIIGKMHRNITYPGFGRFDEKQALSGRLIGTKDTFFDYIKVMLFEDLKLIQESNYISAKTLEEILKLFESHKSLINSVKEGSLIHHDLADHNITVKDGIITGLFDWEASVVGDPMLDLGSCPTWTAPFEREKILIEGYKTTNDLPEDFKEKMDIYRLRTMIWKIAFVINGNMLSPKHLDKFQNSMYPYKLKIEK